MEYIVLIYGDEKAWNRMPKSQIEQVYAAYRKYTEELQKAGVMKGGSELKPTTTATTVRVRNGKRQVTDGPFSETKEQLGGYYLIDVETLDEERRARAERQRPMTVWHARPPSGRPQPSMRRVPARQHA